ncbi:MAG: hypothetical protein IE909_05960 [Campylobacterales bacterium]|nr:hypothetical protein [Campylobacterales bacterium]
MFIKDKIKLSIQIFLLLLTIVYGIISIFKYKEQRAELNASKTEYKRLLTECTKNAEEYTQNIQDYNKTITSNEDTSTTKIKYIIKYKGEAHETNCTKALKLLNNIVF